MRHPTRRARARAALQPVIMKKFVMCHLISPPNTMVTPEEPTKKVHEVIDNILALGEEGILKFRSCERLLKAQIS